MALVCYILRTEKYLMFDLNKKVTITTTFTNQKPISILSPNKEYIPVSDGFVPKIILDDYHDWRINKREKDIEGYIQVPGVVVENQRIDGKFVKSPVIPSSKIKGIMRTIATEYFLKNVSDVDVHQLQVVLKGGVVAKNEKDEGSKKNVSPVDAAFPDNTIVNHRHNATKKDSILGLFGIMDDKIKFAGKAIFESAIPNEISECIIQDKIVRGTVGDAIRGPLSNYYDSILDVDNVSSDENRMINYACMVDRGVKWTQTITLYDPSDADIGLLLYCWQEIWNKPLIGGKSRTSGAGGELEHIETTVLRGDGTTTTDYADLIDNFKNNFNSIFSK